MRLTWWKTTRAHEPEPPDARFMPVLGVQDRVLQLILDGPAEPTPDVMLAIGGDGVRLRWLSTNGVPTGGIGGRFLWVVVFDPAPEEVTALHLTVAVAGIVELRVWLTPTWS